MVQHGPHGAAPNAGNYDAFKDVGARLLMSAPSEKSEKPHGSQGARVAVLQKNKKTGKKEEKKNRRSEKIRSDTLYSFL